MRRACFRVIHKDKRGAALVEFALIAPVLIFTLLGLFELGYNMYMQSQLQGAVQQAARKSTLESATASQEKIDERVEAAVKMIASNATITFDRKSYSTFSGVSQPEDFVDLNEDGICNDGEQFEDANGNGSWDMDRGREGLGGARDVVLYKVAIEYPRAFGASKLLGFSDNAKFEATTVMRNQPYGDGLAGGLGQCT